MKLESSKLAAYLNKINIQLTDDYLAKLLSFVNIVIETNQSFNLTAITSPEEALIKHIYDSLSVLTLSQWQHASLILDVGSGAGFPCIPLAICNPDKQFISLEATQKKVKFQEKTCISLGITNLSPYWGRAEEFGQDEKYREHFDLVLSRAVANTGVLLELTVPFCKVNSYCILYKGRGYQLEISTAQASLTTLKSIVEKIHHFELPENYGDRFLIVVQKREKTSSNFPRKPGVPQKHPL